MIDSSPNLSKKLRESFDLYCPSNDFATVWGNEIEDFLMLLKNLLANPIGRNSNASRLPFVKATDRLVSYKELNEPLTADKSKLSPYLIATGVNINEIHKYFIHVEGSFINVS